MTRSFKYCFLKFRFDLLIPAVWGMISLAFVCYAFFCVASFNQTKKVKKQSISNYESIGQGPFSLNPQYLNPHTPKVLDSFFVTKGSQRILGSDYLHLGSHDSDQLSSLSYNDFLKLEILKDESGKDVVWFIKPIKEEKEAVIFEAKQGAHGSMMIALPVVDIQDTQKDKYQTFLNSEALSVIQKAKLAGMDCLFEDDTTKKAVLLIDLKQILSLNINDALYFVNGKWQKERALSCPIAELRQEGLDFHFLISDASGFFSHIHKLAKSYDETFNIASMIPDSVKVYESGVISCQIGHQRLVLKKGDWVLKTQHVCQILKTKMSLEKLINFERYGPLCVIDDIQISKERSLVRGKIFSPLRIKSHPFEIEAPIVKVTKNLSKPRSKGVRKESL